MNATDVELPSALDAEEQVLGAILATGSVPAEVSSLLQPDDFYKSEHRDLYRVLLGMHSRGEATDTVSVAARLNGTKNGGLFARDLAAGATAIPGATAQHAQLVREAGERRRLMLGAQRIIEAAASPGDLASVQAMVASLSHSSPSLGWGEKSSRLLSGMAFAHIAENAGPALWGHGDQILWQPGEPFMPYGPQGVGKTTLTQRLALARAGVFDELLGLPVAPSEDPILYVAADRPLQAARSWRRMVGSLSPEDQEMVDARINFWKGPLPFDIGQEPEKLAAFLKDLHVRTFFGDSLKDLAVDLSKDEVAGRVNRAWQLCIASDIEVVDLHHPRKTPAGSGSKPKTLDEVYGGTWLTAGHGSVVLLWGQPGDPIVELSHLKQPMEEVGPLRVIIDHHAGAVAIHDGGDPLAILRASRGGIAARDVARTLFNATKPTDSEVEKARRKLEKLVESGLAFSRPSGRDDKGHPTPVMYLALPPNGLQEPLGEEKP